MKIFITGLNGFVGSHLARYLKQHGAEVTGSVRTQEKVLEWRAKGFDCVIASLDQSFNPKIFSGIDVLIHCAHDISGDVYRVNFNGTVAFCEAAASQNVSQQLFLSSYSAMENSSSTYGMVKRDLERYFIKKGFLVIKPGLVVGSGGLFQRISRLMRRFPVVPLIDGGSGKMAIIGMDDLALITNQLIQEKRTGLYRLFLKERPTLYEFCRALRKEGRYKAIFLPIPYYFIYFPVWLLSKAGLSLPVSLESLKGFQQNQENCESSDLEKFLKEPSSLTHMIHKAVAND